MAGSAVIGSLRVNLGIDSAQFDKGLKAATLKLGLIGGAAIAAGEALGNLLGRAIRDVATAVPDMINQFDDLSKLSQKIGIPVDELSKLKYAADLSDVSLDQLSSAFGLLSKNMADVASGAGKAAATAFSTLGVSVVNADGTLRSASDVFADVAAAFGNMQDGATKTALAMAIFGKSGKDLIPLLNSGTSGLAALTAEAVKFGVVIDQNTAQAAEAFNDSLTRMHAIFGGLATKISAALLPTLNKISEALLGAVSNSSLMEEAADILATALKGLVTAGIIVGETFQAVGTAIGGVVAAILLAAQGNMQRAGDALKNSFADVTAGVQASADAIVKIWDSTVDNVTSVTVHKMTPPVIQGFKNVAAAATDAEPVITRAFDKISDAGSQVGRTLESSFSNIFDGLVDGTFDARSALTGLLKDLVKLQLNNVFKTLSGSLFGGGLVGGILGGGAGVATAAPLNLLGFAGGGGFRVGGAGGIDSQMVQFRATPGEMVDIHKGDAGGTGTANVQVVVNNKADADVKQRTEKGPDGPRIVLDIVRRGIATGDLDSAHKGRFGLRPVKV
jgi:hypothetical protein